MGVAEGRKKKNAGDPTVVELANRAVELAKQATALSHEAAYFDTLAHAEYLAGNMAGARDAWATVYKINPAYDDVDPLCDNDKKIFEDLKRQAGIAK